MISEKQNKNQNKILKNWLPQIKLLFSYLYALKRLYINIKVFK